MDLYKLFPEEVNKVISKHSLKLFAWFATKSGSL